MDIIKMINEFEQAHQDAAHIAHIALHDYNIADGHLCWLLDEYIPQHREEYLQEHFWHYLPDCREAAESEIDEVIDFLNQLLAIPQADREEAVDQYLDQTLPPDIARLLS